METTVQTGKTDQTKMEIRRKENRVLRQWRLFLNDMPFWILSLPAIILLVCFRLFPMFGLILPFKNYTADKGFFFSEWAGLSNFEYLFRSKDVLIATRNTLLYNIGFILIGIVAGVLVALFMYELSSKFVKGYQTILFIPYFISWIVAAYIVKALLDIDNGVMNQIISMFGGEPINWYGEKGYWPTIIMISSLWKNVGYNSIIYYAALIGVSPEYFEAARIDGAGKLKQMWYISLPMIKNVIIVLFIVHIGKIMYADFGLFYNIPLNSTLLYDTTDVLDTYVYRAMINLGDIGMSSAAAFYQSVVGFLLVIATNFIVKKVDTESGMF